MPSSTVPSRRKRDAWTGCGAEKMRMAKSRHAFAGEGGRGRPAAPRVRKER